MDSPEKKSNTQLTKDGIKKRLAEITVEISKAERIESILESKPAKEIEELLINSDLAEIRAAYCKLNPINENFLVSHARLQGAEMQLLKYKEMFNDKNSIKKVLVNERDFLLNIQSEMENIAPSEGRRILSSKIKKERNNVSG